MLHVILIAQLNTTPDNSPPLPPVTLDSQQRLNTFSQQQWSQKLEEQQRLLELSQKLHQLEKRELYERLPPSRLDCFPLFPPVAGYPPGSSKISCSHL